jgi:hypothetical protein
MKLCEHCPLHPPKVLCVECATPFRPTRSAEDEAAARARGRP